MNKMTDKLATKYGRSTPKQSDRNPLTHTSWLHVVEVRPNAAVFVNSREAAGTYAYCKAATNKKRLKWPRTFTLPLAALTLHQEKPDGAVLMEMPLALALDQGLVRHSFSSRE